MPIREYEYTVEKCDVLEDRRGSLTEYRAFRQNCLEQLRGNADSSITNQMHSLAWNTVVFRSLNEARRIEPNRNVNGAMWELICDGYVHIMSLGVRKLVDRDSRTNSILNVVLQLENRAELLTRENFVCFDGLPYDSERAYRAELAELESSHGKNARWIPTSGPDAWGTSALLHKSFDALAGFPATRERRDLIEGSVMERVKAELSHPAIKKIVTVTDRAIAHAERVEARGETIFPFTHNDVADALRTIVYVVNFISSQIFYDAAFGSVVPVPQYDVFAGLDQPWITPLNMPKLSLYWQDLSREIDDWAHDGGKKFISAKT